MSEQQFLGHAIAGAIGIYPASNKPHTYIQFKLNTHFKNTLEITAAVYAIEWVCQRGRLDGTTEMAIRSLSAYQYVRLIIDFANTGKMADGCPAWLKNRFAPVESNPVLTVATASAAPAVKFTVKEMCLALKMRPASTIDRAEVYTRIYALAQKGDATMKAFMPYMHAITHARNGMTSVAVEAKIRKLTAFNYLKLMLEFANDTASPSGEKAAAWLKAWAFPSL